MLKNLKNVLRKTPFFNPAKMSYYLSRRTARRIYNLISPTAVVLLYHRVAVINNDVNLLSVAPDKFEHQLGYLKTKFKIIGLGEMAKDLQFGRIKNNSLAITFDDGYADNLHNALPILEKYNIPATVFVTTGKIGDDKPFFWEENMADKDRGRCVTSEELKLLARTPLIEIGAHTVNHPKLSKITIDEQEKEINESRNALEQILGKPIKSFAYPFGGKGTFDEDTVSLVIKNDFDYACTNIHRRINKSTFLHAIPRFIIRDWTVEELKKEIKKWL